MVTLEMCEMLPLKNPSFPYFSVKKINQAQRGERYLVRKIKLIKEKQLNSISALLDIEGHRLSKTRYHFNQSQYTVLFSTDQLIIPSTKTIFRKIGFFKYIYTGLFKIV